MSPTRKSTKTVVMNKVPEKVKPGIEEASENEIDMLSYDDMDLKPCTKSKSTLCVGTAFKTASNIEKNNEEDEDESDSVFEAI